MKLVFNSPQGGSGKTILSINTAIIYAELGLKTLLIDMCVFGGISTNLRLYLKGKSNKDVFTNGDITNLFNIVNKNLYVIQTPNAVFMNNEINEDNIEELLNRTEKKFDIVIIDSSSELTANNMKLLELATGIIIPLTQDMSSTWKSIQYKELIKENISKKKKMYTVLNMCRKEVNFNNLEFEKETNLKCLSKIPFYSKKFQDYINQGYMLNSKYNLRAYKTFEKLAIEIVKEMNEDIYSKIKGA